MLFVHLPPRGGSFPTPSCQKAHLKGKSIPNPFLFISSSFHSSSSPSLGPIYLLLKSINIYIYIAFFFFLKKWNTSFVGFEVTPGNKYLFSLPKASRMCVVYTFPEVCSKHSYVIPSAHSMWHLRSGSCSPHSVFLVLHMPLQEQKHRQENHRE